MRLAIIENEVVVNVVIADLDFAEKMGWNYVQLADGVQCESGWSYDGKEFIRPVKPEIDEAEAL